MKQVAVAEKVLSKSSAVLRAVLVDRIDRNPSYSLRAMARSLGVSHTYLSLVLSGKKTLSPGRAIQFAETLKLSDAQKKNLLHKSSKRSLSVKFRELDVDSFKAISSWYHIAILDLVEIKGFKEDSQWIATRLGISSLQADEALFRLLRIGWLSRRDGRLRKAEAMMGFDTKQSHGAIREFHKQMIAKSLEALEATKQSAFDKRDITGLTMAINPKKIAEAKKRIKEFKRELYELVSSGDCTEIYQLNIQLFSLTKNEGDL